MLGPCQKLNSCETARSNEHHLFWPKNRYITPIEKLFRDHPDHKVQLCICEHNRLHQETFPPPKPPLEEMILKLTVSFE